MERLGPTLYSVSGILLLTIGVPENGGAYTSTTPVHTISSTGLLETSSKR